MLEKIKKLRFDPKIQKIKNTEKIFLKKPKTYNYTKRFISKYKTDINGYGF